MERDRREPATRGGEATRKGRRAKADGAVLAGRLYSRMQVEKPKFLAAIGRTAVSGIFEVKDLLAAVAGLDREASDALVAAPTPEDRWFTPANGWPSEPSSARFDSLPLPSGFKASSWEPPPLLCLTASEAPHLFRGGRAIGEVRIEVLEAEGLPRLLQLGAVDPYAIIVFESFAARTSGVRNDRSPRWGADAPRAFRFPIQCPYSSIDIAMNDEDIGAAVDDSIGRICIDLSQVNGRTVYDEWFPLQYCRLRREVGHRGSLRVRYSVLWYEDRMRALAAPTIPGPGGLALPPYRLLPAACCLLPAACCLLPAACCLALPPYRLQRGAALLIEARVGCGSRSRHRSLQVSAARAHVHRPLHGQKSAAQCRLRCAGAHAQPRPLPVADVQGLLV